MSHSYAAPAFGILDAQKYLLHMESDVILPARLLDEVPGSASTVVKISK